MRGLLIALEGTEGSGKSTQARRLADALAAAGLEPVLTREPGGTPIGERVRAILLDPADSAILAETEALLMAAARAQHVGEVIRPALAQGAVVITDRYTGSTYAYQGGGRGLEIAELRRLQRFATGGLEPDLSVLIDLPVEVGLARRFGDPAGMNRIDLADRAFHERVRATFLQLAAGDPAHWSVVDGRGEPDDVAADVLRAVNEVVKPSTATGHGAARQR